MCIRDSTCDDSYRIDYLRAHIEEMKKAVELDGVDLLGYTPVSYTHLDVYKRQRIYCSPPTICTAAL